MRAVFVVLLLASVAAAEEPWVALQRQDWVTQWDRMVESQQRTPRGKTFTLLSPAPGAHEQVLLRKDARPSDQVGVLGMIAPPRLLAASSVEVAVGEVERRLVDPDDLRALAAAGAAAAVYWTTPHQSVSSDGKKHPFSTVYVRGVAAGVARLLVTLADGAQRLVTITVK
jgi:hypothetical protein